MTTQIHTVSVRTTTTGDSRVHSEQFRDGSEIFEISILVSRDENSDSGFRWGGMLTDNINGPGGRSSIFVNENMMGSGALLEDIVLLIRRRVKETIRLLEEEEPGEERAYGVGWKKSTVVLTDGTLEISWAQDPSPVPPRDDDDVREPGQRQDQGVWTAFHTPAAGRPTVWTGMSADMPAAVRTAVTEFFNDLYMPVPS